MPVCRRSGVAIVAALICAGCSPATPPPGSADSSPVPTASASSSAADSPATPSATPASSPSNSTSASPSSVPSSSPSASANPPGDQIITLPRGGREVFPRYRLVGYAGLTGAKTLGRLGEGSLDVRVTEMQRRAKPYADDREILPLLEVIASVVQGSPGRDNLYRSRISDQKIETYLTSARKHKALLLLNIQPGRSTFMAEAKAYEKWLREPDVGLALDPEWAMGPGQVPGRVFGKTTGAEIDEVSRYLASMVSEQKLPEKVLIYHQLAPRIVTEESQLKDHRGVAVVKSVDGIGSPDQKRRTYRVVSKSTPKHVHPGFKLFYTEDEIGTRLMTPDEVLALKPKPEYVLYE